MRIGLIALCLFLSTVQSFVAQTHVHSLADTVVTSQSAANPSSALQDRDDDAPQRNTGGGYSHCPLCQIVLHGGGAPLPAYVLPLALIVAKAFVAPERFSLSSIAAVSYAWRSRGPPLS